MTHKKPITKIIAGVLSVVMVFSVLMFVSPTEAQAISLNATDTGFYNVSYSERETIFGVGSQIRVENKLRTSKNSATYTLTEEGWKTTDAFVWNGASKNEFEAWYPFNASYTEFTIPTDQSSDQLLGAADWMTASSGKIDKPENHTLNLYFGHHLAKVTVNIVEWNSEFDGSEKIIEDLKIYSKGAALTATYGDSGATITATDGETGITPLVSGASYTAIVAPAKYEDTDKFMTFTVDGQEMTVLATPSRLNEVGLQAGLHYLFDLKVGKDCVAIQSVEVTDWTDRIINDVESEEAYSNIDAAILTADELNAAVTMALETGVTDIRIKLAADAGQEMFSAIWTAFSESTAADGSINLTISGAKTIPEFGFFDNDNYFENGEKNIAGDKLKSLTLTDVETIGDFAFSACTYLESVNLPQVVTIGECAFNEWKKGTKLTSLNLPNATTIGDWAFAYSSLLTSVNLPKVVTIGTVAFADCDLRTLDLPEATTIGGEAFMNNDNLVSCSAPKATNIDYYPWGSNGTSKLERLELTAVGNFTLSNNLFAYTSTEQIDLVLNKDKESQVTQNEDGTATWATTNQYGGSLTYTFKSITFVD